MWAEVLLLGASSYDGDLATKARRCVLAMCGMVQLPRRLDLGCVKGTVPQEARA